MRAKFSCGLVHCLKVRMVGVNGVKWANAFQKKNLTKQLLASFRVSLGFVLCHGGVNWNQLGWHSDWSQGAEGRDQGTFFFGYLREADGKKCQETKLFRSHGGAQFVAGKKKNTQIWRFWHQGWRENPLRLGSFRMIEVRINPAMIMTGLDLAVRLGASMRWYVLDRHFYIIQSRVMVD